MWRRLTCVNLSNQFIEKYACDMIKRNKEVFDELAER